MVYYCVEYTLSILKKDVFRSILILRILCPVSFLGLIHCKYNNIIKIIVYVYIYFSAVMKGKIYIL